MAAEPERVTVDEGLRPLFEEAMTRPVIVDIGGHAYRVRAEEVLPDSPYTLEGVYGSLPPLNGRPGSAISDDELDGMIEAAKEAHARDVLKGMDAAATE